MQFLSIFLAIKVGMYSVYLSLKFHSNKQKFLQVHICASYRKVFRVLKLKEHTQRIKIARRLPFLKTGHYHNLKILHQRPTLCRHIDIQLCDYKTQQTGYLPLVKLFFSCTKRIMYVYRSVAHIIRYVILYTLTFSSQLMLSHLPLYFIAERSTGVFDHATTDWKEHGKSAAQVYEIWISRFFAQAATN